MSKNSYTTGCGWCDNILCSTHGCQKYRFPSLDAHPTSMIPRVAVPEATPHGMKADDIINIIVEEFGRRDAELATLRAEVERLKSDRWLGPYGIIPSDYAHAMDCLRAEVERLRAALERISKWVDAHPLDVFPEPDLAKVNEVLKEAGLSLGAVSASNMRHVISGVGIFARVALATKEQEINVAEWDKTRWE